MISEIDPLPRIVAPEMPAILPTTSESGLITISCSPSNWSTTKPDLAPLQAHDHDHDLVRVALAAQLEELRDSQQRHDLSAQRDHFVPWTVRTSGISTRCDSMTESSGIAYSSSPTRTRSAWMIASVNGNLIVKRVPSPGRGVDVEDAFESR